MLSATLQKYLSTIERTSHLAPRRLARAQRLLTGFHRVTRALTFGVAGLVVCSFVALSVLSGQQNAMASSNIAAVRQPRETNPAQPAEVKAEPANMLEAGPPDIGDAGEQTGLSQGQREKAASIIATGEEMGIPRRGWVIALARAMQESKLLMLPTPARPHR